MDIVTGKQCLADARWVTDEVSNFILTSHWVNYRFVILLLRCVHEYANAGIAEVFVLLFHQILQPISYPCLNV